MILWQSLAGSFPWWVTLIGTVTGVALGILGALPWRSTAQAATERADNAIKERNEIREVRNQQIQTIVELNAQLEVYKAKTDLNGLREEFRKTINGLKEEFQKHSDQDAVTAGQQIAALSAVEATLRVIQSQIERK